MAFVFRSKRDLKLSDVEQNNVYPGEYYKEKQHKRLSEEKSPYKRCPECNKLVSKTLDIVLSATSPES